MSLQTEYDAIVVGSGISGGWAAKELTEKGLKVLMLERGRPIQHGVDYVGEHTPPWKVPYGGKPLRELYAEEYPIQSETHGFDETTRHFFNNDKENPYVQNPDKPFMWKRANGLGGRSLIWGRQVYRWSDLDFEANKKMVMVSTGQFATRTLRPGIPTSKNSSVSAAKSWACRTCRMASSRHR